MTNIVADLIGKGLDAAGNDWRIKAGMVAAGVLIGLGKWAHDKRKARKAGKK